MEKRLLIFFLSINCFISNAQEIAVTQKGDTIYVYNNGTWSFDLLEEAPPVFNELDYLNEELKIDEIEGTFKYSDKVSKEVTNEMELFTIKYNPSVWKRIPPATVNDDAEFAFQNIDTDIWCIVISEETSIAPDKLFKIAKKSMEDNIGSKTKVIKTESRNVNGHKVIRGALLADVSGISFIFDSYYFSNEKGSVQFTVYTSDKLWKKNEQDILEFLNGFIAN